jgi:putative mycofactocin binding protein MftB
MIVRYRVAPGVRVRPEGFGLLFYNARTTNLTFVKSRHMLVVDRSPGETLITVNDQIDPRNTKASRVLQTLVENGLISETPDL